MPIYIAAADISFCDPALFLLTKNESEKNIEYLAGGKMGKITVYDLMDNNGKF